MEFSDKRSCKILLVSLKAGNSGLNLIAASQVIMLDPFWNPYIEVFALWYCFRGMYNVLTPCQEQAIDRAHRIGQQKPVQVHRIIVENTVEDRILALQEKKRELIEAALDENASKSISRLGVRELGFLFVSRSKTLTRKARADYVRMCLRDPSPAHSLNPSLSSAHMHPGHTHRQCSLPPTTFSHHCLT